ncbi:MAG: aminopeptidase P family protein, partial [Planctomycetales bacterium]
MTKSTEQQIPTIMAGIPNVNKSFYRRIRFSVGDPAALIDAPKPDGGAESTLILRDIEMERAKQSAPADHIACPADFAPEQGLSGDRETATAQAAAVFLQRMGTKRVRSDRTLPLIYVHELAQLGIEVDYDPELGVASRRRKDAQEVEWLRKAQAATEDAIRMACELIAGADADAEGLLSVGGEPLTSERVRAEINVYLLRRGYSNPESIVACGPGGAVPHNIGHGTLRTEQPVIVDVFPCNRETLYNGDCTRTVVHGQVPEQVRDMHAAVVVAKADAIAAVKAGATGEAVHQATSAAIIRRGYAMGLPSADDPASYVGMVHGTGHGVGLDVHEPPLLDKGGPPLVVGDCLTVEPGLYGKSVGGVRV